MKIISQHRALVAFAVAGLAVAAAQAASGVPETSWGWHPNPAVGEAVPPLPPPSTYPVQLVLDDDSSDGAFGVGGPTARQFLWFNRFSPAAGFHLDEVWVLFPSGANMAVGGAVQIAIYEDPDNDPTNGANLLGSFAATIQAADDNTFSIYAVPGSPVIPSGSDLLVGVVPRFIVSGVTSPTLPAALDTTATQSRSWVAAWSTDPPDPPVLVPLPDQTLSLVDAFVPGGGNFMIRAFGTEQAVTEIPALGSFGLAALALALGVAGALVLRRRKTSAAVLALLLLALAAPAGAVTVDSFTTDQAALSDPGTVSSSVTGGAGDPIGTRRGMVVDLLTGAGPTTASVAGGNLVLAVTDTTPNSRGEVLVSWDGDTNPLVLSPTGLANANLTTGNASGFQLDFVSTTVVTEIEVTVYDDATNFSRAVRRVAAGGAQSVLIPFAEFRVAGGAGAVFSSVGAIEMTVRGGEGTITLSQVTTTAPTVAATKVDTQIVDTDGDTRVDPGDRVRYTVTVTNSGNEAVAVDLSDTVDANTTLVPGSVSSTPVAHNDQYGWFGNVTLAVDGVTSHPLLLANDADADGDDVDVQSVVSPTAAGGTVTLDDGETGEFTYTPPAGFKGVDSFSYTIHDGETHTATATAYIHLEGIVWFVDNACTVGCGAGTQSSPFQTLPAAEAPSGDNDIIYVRTGLAAYDTGPANGFTMDVDEQLLGEGVALVLGGTTIVPAGTPPTLTNNDGTPGRGLTLAATGAGTDTVRGLTIGATGAAKIFGSAFGTFASDTVTLNGNGQALHLFNGALASTFASITSGSSALSGITLQQVSGTLTSTGGTSITNPTTQGILVDQSTASVGFGNTSVTGTGTDRVSLQNNSGGTRTFGTLTTTGGTGAGFLHAVGGGTTTVTGATSITNPGGYGISIENSNATVTFAATVIDRNVASFFFPALDLVSNGSNVTNFASLTITNIFGQGIYAPAGGTLNIGGTGNSVQVTGGPALNLTSTSLGSGATFNTATSTNSGGPGINLDNVTGPLTINGGAISGPSGIAFDLNGGSANVTYAGSISNVANALLIDITGRTGGTVNLSGNLSSITLGDGINVSSNTGGTINFSGGNKTLATGAATAVNLATNTGATINFTGGGLAITTTSGTGFNATGGATAITVQGAANSIASGTGTALNVAASTIGASAVTFQSIASNGASSGIVLNNTGGGALVVTGTGSAGSGGTIQSSTASGVLLTSATGTSLSRMVITGSGDDGIFGTNLNGLSVSDSSITNNGNSTADEGIYLVDPTGALAFTSVTATGNAHNNLWIYDSNNTGGNATLTISGGSYSSTSNANGNHGALIDILGTAILGTSTINGATISNNKVIGLQVLSGDSASISDLTISANTFADTGTGNSQEISMDVSKAGTSNLTAKVLNNTITGHNSHGMNFFTAAGAGTTGTYNARISGNTIGNPAVAGSGSLIGNCMRINLNGDAAAAVLVDGNVLRQCPNGRGIEVIGRNGTGATSVTVTNNDVNTNDVSGFPLCAILVQSNDLTVAKTVRSDVRGNTVPSGTAFDILPTYLCVAETGTSSSQLVDSPPASASCTAQLTSTNTGSASASAGCALIAGPIPTPP